MDSDSALTDPVAPPPLEACGYSVATELSPGQTYLAIGPGGRGVVIKKLEPDCLLNNRLHPRIRDRLARVRELAHPGVANLHGVEWDGHDAWLVWEYLEGERISEYAAHHCKSMQTVASLWRELVLAVQTLHVQGIVHGSVNDGNVIVSPTGMVKLTHVSPYLYTEAADDVEGVIDLLRDGAAGHPCRCDELGQALTNLGETGESLHLLATRLAIISETPERATTDEVARPPVRSSRKFIRWLAVVLVVGLLITLFLLAIARLK